jgi:hypothetical protein
MSLPVRLRAVYKKTTGIADFHQKAVSLLERGVYTLLALSLKSFGYNKVMM